MEVVEAVGIETRSNLEVLDLLQTTKNKDVTLEQLEMGMKNKISAFYV